MLSLLSTVSLAKPTPKIGLKLLVWFDDIEKEVKYVYGQSSNVDFGSHPKPQELEIELITPDTVSQTDPRPRFHLAHFSTTRLDKIDNVTPSKPGTTHPPQLPNNSSFQPDTKKILFKLKMDPKDSFYIDVIVIDLADNNRLICCDPQVENGSKT